MEKRIEDGLDIDGIIIGPAPLICENGTVFNILPPVYTFRFELARILARVKQHQANSSHIEYQELFINSLNNLNSGLLLYFKNRLLFMLAKNDIKNADLNSIAGIIKAYKRHISCDLKLLCGQESIQLLNEITITRGKKHHDNSRYLPDYKIASEIIDPPEKLVAVLEKVRSIVTNLDQELDRIKEIYTIKIDKRENEVVVEIISIPHAFDLIRGKIIKKRNTNGYDPTCISYFSFIIGLKKKGETV
ncbi:MAG: hypothetical protein AB1295_05520 [Candidatus Micrarchaeota archaeon]